MFPMCFHIFLTKNRIEPPARGLSDQLFENSKMLLLQAVDSIYIFQRIFGFVWICLETFDLDGHNLGTVKQPLKLRGFGYPFE